MRPLLTGAVALAVLFIAGCGREALNFNNTLANGNKKLNEAGKKFGQTIEPALKGEAVKLDNVKAAYKAAVEAVEQVKKDAAAVKVPDSKSAKKLAEGYLRFLTEEEDAIKNKFGKIAQWLEKDPEPKSSAGTLKERIKTVLREANDQERTALVSLHVLQREFAKEHSLPLKQPPAP